MSVLFAAATLSAFNADITRLSSDVRFWGKADIDRTRGNVR
jgi:hypothetical protein